ncbi:hypothetical protein KCU85_g315, partial [Aureobasidium melanogenum]
MPTQVASQGQWWSIFRTQRLQELQWWARSGLTELHFLQYRGLPDDLAVRGRVGRRSRVLEDSDDVSIRDRVQSRGQEGFSIPPMTAGHRQRPEGSSPALHSSSVRPAGPSSYACDGSLATVTCSRRLQDAKNIPVLSSSSLVDPWRMWRCPASEGVRSDRLHLSTACCFIFKPSCEYPIVASTLLLCFVIHVFQRTVLALNTDTVHLLNLLVCQPPSKCLDVTLGLLEISDANNRVDALADVVVKRHSRHADTTLLCNLLHHVKCVHFPVKRPCASDEYDWNWIPFSRHAFSIPSVSGSRRMTWNSHWFNSRGTSYSASACFISSMSSLLFMRSRDSLSILYGAEPGVTRFLKLSGTTSSRSRLNLPIQTERDSQVRSLSTMNFQASFTPSSSFGSQCHVALSPQDHAPMDIQGICTSAFLPFNVMRVDV